MKAQSNPESFWLAFVVMLHVGSAIGLLAYYWRDWILLIRAWLRTLRTPAERRHADTSRATRPRLSSASSSSGSRIVELAALPSARSDAVSTHLVERASHGKCLVHAARCRTGRDENVYLICPVREPELRSRA